MDTPSFILTPITTLNALFTGIALPFIAGSRPGRSHAGGPLASADARKRTDAAGRKTRPPEPGADDAAPAGYPYVPCARIRYHGSSAGTRRRVQEVPIIKKTAKLIYYPGGNRDRARPWSAPAASAANSSRPTPGATTPARGISPQTWCALRTAAATATARILRDRFHRGPREVRRPTLVLHGEDDQIVPVNDSARKPARPIKGAHEISYPRAPHGLTATYQDQFNADRPAFLRS